MGISQVRIFFDASLRFLLERRLRSEEWVLYTLNRRASIKDIVESLGVPHTEVGGLVVNGREERFEYIAGKDDTIEIRAVPVPWDIFSPSALRPQISAIRFVVDVNVAKLATFLRMAGFDARGGEGLRDDEIAAVSAWQQRILLTRDRNLLKRKQIVFGRLVRASDPEEQLGEILGLFDLWAKVRPLSRCLRCNRILEPVDKAAILSRLEPLTRKYFHDFTRCAECDRIYWAGSHKEKMARTLRHVVNERLS